MKLAELKPWLAKCGDSGGLAKVEDLPSAEGVFFLCPACFEKNGGPEGTHGILLPFEGRAPSVAFPGVTRWRAGGDGLADLTLSPSVLIHPAGDCPGWHGWVTVGTARSC